VSFFRDRSAAEDAAEKFVGKIRIPDTTSSEDALKGRKAFKMVFTEGFARGLAFARGQSMPEPGEIMVPVPRGHIAVVISRENAQRLVKALQDDQDNADYDNEIYTLTCDALIKTLASGPRVQEA
jgi:hypothetical protein